MKILIDLGHPAHIHYFKNFAYIMQSKGHEFAFVARDKEVLHSLMAHYNINYVSRGRGRKTLFGKLLYIIYADLVIYKVAKKFKPDLFLSFASTYAAHVSRFMVKPHIVLDDTEHAKLELMMYSPFSDVILNPSCFWRQFSPKQLFFDSYMELFYLNPKYFTPDISILNDIGVLENEKYVVLRFVSWQASHDIGHKGISNKNKIRAVNEFKKYAKVLISSEGPLPIEIEKYRMRISSEKIHSVLAFASLFYGESATMASECAVLGTPAIYLDNVGRGYTKEEEIKYNLVFNYTESFEDQDSSILKGVELLKKAYSKPKWKQLSANLLNEKIDGTAFLVWFVENFPQSEGIMRGNPNYQQNFKNEY
jgi:predicted glycosyltransferase